MKFIARTIVFLACCYGLNIAVCLLYLTLADENVNIALSEVSWVAPSIAHVSHLAADSAVKCLTLLWGASYIYLSTWFLIPTLRNRLAGIDANYVGVAASAALLIANFCLFGMMNGSFIQIGRNGRSIYLEAISSVFGAVVLGNLIVVTTLAAAIYLSNFLAIKLFHRN